MRQASDWNFILINFTKIKHIGYFQEIVMSEDSLPLKKKLESSKKYLQNADLKLKKKLVKRLSFGALRLLVQGYIWAVLRVDIFKRGDLSKRKNLDIIEKSRMFWLVAQWANF